MKKICMFLVAVFMSCMGAFATTDIASNASSADCTQPVLGTYSGSSNFEAKWNANSVPLRWYNQGTLMDVQDAADTCNYDGTLTIPSIPPERIGYEFAGWKVVRLPAGYTELEYIESTGTQWIDTGYKPNQNSRFQVKVKFNSIASGTIIGARRSATTNIFAVASTGTIPNVYFNGGYGSWGGTITSPTDTDIHILDLNKNVFSIDGMINKTFTASTVTPNQNAYLFVMNTGGDADSNTYFSGRIYSAQLYDNALFVRNFIPARRNSDNEIGMFDTVSGTFFTNAGTGEFIGGPATE